MRGGRRFTQGEAPGALARRQALHPGGSAWSPCEAAGASPREKRLEPLRGGRRFTQEEAPGAFVRRQTLQASQALQAVQAVPAFQAPGALARSSIGPRA